MMHGDRGGDRAVRIVGQICAQGRMQGDPAGLHQLQDRDGVNILFIDPIRKRVSSVFATGALTVREPMRAGVEDIRAPGKDDGAAECPCRLSLLELSVQQRTNRCAGSLRGYGGTRSDVGRDGLRDDGGDRQNTQTPVK